MILLRILLLILIVGAVLWLLKKLFSDNEPEAIESKSSENMLRCKTCGTHIPESEAITVGNDVFCSQQHADQDLDSHSDS